MSEDFPGGKAAKRVVLIGRDLAKSVLPRHLVERAGEPGAAVGDGPIEIKNGKDAVSHAGLNLSVQGLAYQRMDRRRYISCKSESIL